MSDGPHKSLPMSRGWRKVAEYACNTAFALPDVCDAIMTALEQDWRKDITPGFIGSIQEVLGGATLFSDLSIQALEDLRSSVAGCVMANALLDHTVYALNDGKSGNMDLQEAVTRTVTDWSARCARQVEEHYLRKAGPKNATHVRTRLDEAMQQTHFTSLTSRLLDTGSRPGPAHHSRRCR